MGHSRLDTAPGSADDHLIFGHVICYKRNQILHVQMPSQLGSTEEGGVCSRSYLWHVSEQEVDSKFGVTCKQLSGNII